MKSSANAELFLFLKMQSFLEDVLQEELEKESPISDMVFVLPSKRAGSFLRNLFANKARKTTFSPEIYSIEVFIEALSGLKYADNTQQLFELFKVYQKTFEDNKDAFLDFSKWGQTVLQDFNEIDRYLVDAEKIFSNLAAIQELTHWSVEAKRTKLMQGYLDFWNSLSALYSNFNNQLLEKGLGHQGLVYRKATQDFEKYLKKNSNKRHIFLGFNALNNAESQIVQKILKAGNAAIYWDIDTTFLEDAVHDAGYFIREHKNSWPFLKSDDLKGVSSNYGKNKNIEITGVPKYVAQAKYVGELLTVIQDKHPENIKSTAVILADESLLNPVLNSIPPSIEAVNITMGYALQKTPLADFFSQLITLYLQNESQGWYYKNMLAVLGHPYAKELFNDHEEDYFTILDEYIKHRNLTYITPDILESILNSETQISLLFSKNPLSPIAFIEKCQAIIIAMRTKFAAKNDPLAIEYLYRFNALFEQLAEMAQQHDFINDLKTFQGLYNELLSSETVNFEGDPLEGLQIMGMLESRNLDFETVIITSVNEGILPSGKTNNSFIPFDLKKGFGLPTYKEKDAVYTYHFYRLLQRAKNIHIIYNTEPDVLEGGEKSRLITQLLTDSNISGEIKHKIAAPALIPNKQYLETIEKENALIDLIKAHSKDGFSPTTLTTYIRNPIDFYKRVLLGIDNVMEVEETVAANTFGTILHDALEELYKPLIDKQLTKANLKALKPKINAVVKNQFSISYKGSDITKGKNLIAFNVIIRYLENFIENEIKETQKHEIKILALEKKMTLELNVPGLDFPVNLKGKLDRIDMKDGVIRIIDYKTGKVEENKLGIVDFQEDLMNYDYSKAFQLLCYSMLYESHTSSPFEAGIISFKNISAGLLSFTTKDKHGRGATKEPKISPATLVEFKEVLYSLIHEICDQKKPFIEKEV
jgi:hypothetical protein